MSYEPIKTWVDVAPAYLNFCLAFFRNPRRAFSKVVGAASISSDLTTVCLAGVALSYLILVATSPSALRNDPGVVARLVRQLEPQALPVVAIFVTFVLGTVSHLTGKLFVWVSRLESPDSTGAWEPKLDGAIEDSVNAALGFAAVFLPVASGALCVVSWLPAGNHVGTGVAAIGLALFVLVYFPWSLSSTHRKTKFTNALMAFGGGIFLVSLVSFAATL
jgi:hypothetical protein